MPESKKVVIKVDIHDEKCKRKALKAVSSLPRVESLSMDMNDKKLTLIGDIDPVEACGKLKKWHTEILSVGPAKEEKKDEKKDKKDDEKKNEEAKKKKEEEEEAIRKWLAANRFFNPYMPQHYCVQSVDDYPNDNCVIS